MEIRGITPEQFSNIVYLVDHESYGNLACEWETRAFPQEPSVRYSAKGVPSWRGRLVVNDSHGAGSRRSWLGRHMRAACWHAFRDVFRRLFEVYPGAVVSTTMARYTAENFESTYPATGYVNIGSQIQPAYMPQLCDCSGPSGGMPPETLGMIAARGGETHMGPGTPEAAVRRIDAVLAVKPGRCGWCGGRTGGDAMIWCSPGCQERWQERFALAPVG